MEIVFAFLFVAMFCWMVWAERKLSKKVRERLHRLDKVLEKLEEKAK